jgi:hypothetical protein
MQVQKINVPLYLSKLLVQECLIPFPHVNCSVTDRTLHYKEKKNISNVSSLTIHTPKATGDQLWWKISNRETLFFQMY